MKYFLSFFTILFLFSCSSNDSVGQTNTVRNSLNINYKGYYQVYFEEPYQSETYTNITVTPITEKISPTEIVEVLKVSAYLDNSTENVITFRVLANTIGSNILYNNNFSFRSYGATYVPSNFNFEVLINNGTEFKANFTGELEHWYEGEQRFVYMDINVGTVHIYY